MPTIREATIEDCHAIAPRIRDAEREAVKALFGKDISAECLLKSFEVSDQRFAIVHDGKPLAIFGAMPFSDEAACPWLASTDEMGEHLGWLVRNATRIHRLLQKHYAWLATIIDARDVVAIRLAPRLGLTLAHIEAVEPSGQVFQHVWSTR
ncbi:MAG: hypothetical protein INR68_13880 [Methylobacterium mesophilicum]|nr:hypothetical protein [Methylobacterium mesophilicum]